MDAPSNKIPLGLIRMGASAHIEQLLHEGHLYLNTVGYFRNLEGDAVRSDSDESLMRIVKGVRITVVPNDGSAPLSFDVSSGTLLDAKLRLYHPELERLNVACFTQVHSPGRFSFDSRCKGFGDSALVIVNVPAFLRRVRVAADEMNLRMHCSPVDYVSSSYQGDIGPFRKFDSFAFQNEFRIALGPGNGNPLSLKLGPLADIAMPCSIEELAALEFDVEPPDAA